MEPAKENIKIFLNNRKLWMNYLPPTEDNEVYVYPDYGKETLEKISKYSQFEETEVILWASFTPPTTHFLFHYDQHAAVLTTHGIYHMWDYGKLRKVVDLRDINSIDVGDYCQVRYLNKEGMMRYIQNQDSHFGFTFIHGPNYLDDEYQKNYKEAAHVIEMMIKTWQQYEESLEIEATPFDMDTFLALPYQDRKIIMPTKRSLRASPSHVKVLPINELPKLSFPIGHPIANQLYVGHPLLPSKYLPFEDYQLVFVEDKIREFCEFVQDLGATEISIDCLNSSYNDDNSNTEKTYSGGIEGARRGVSGAVKTSNSRRLIEELSRSINLHQVFEPTKKPILHPNLIWYQHEPSWQRLYNQRMSGGLLTHEERMETKKSQVLEEKELQDIKAEVKGIFAKLNIGFDQNDESRYEQQENAILSIKVQFAPLNELIGENSNSQAKIGSGINIELSANESEYVEEYKECLSNGEISTGERRLLDKLRDKLGIAPSRAKELEELLAAPKLTDDEKEYLEAFKDACEDGKVSDKKRRLLEKLRVMYGISEERARELEDLKIN
jgi:hypothetical protein